MTHKKMRATLSLDLDNTWSYLKIRGCKNWENSPSHLPIFIPLILDFLKKNDQKISFFIVGKDAVTPSDQPFLKQITDQGHTVQNHSFHHEPWMSEWDTDRVFSELKQADDAIFEATGQRPQGFRGPGFSRSPAMLAAIKKMGYLFDASILATSIAPIARLYYVWKMDKKQRKNRENLFGNFSAALLPNSPFYSDGLLEVPVTTIPLFRTPFHLSYLLWLSQFSKKGALAYLKFAITLCKYFKVSPSFLLHPPDFLGKEDVPELSFFPAMQLPKAFKIDFANEVLSELKKHFEIDGQLHLPPQ